jgi:hypothetical protein
MDTKERKMNMPDAKGMRGTKKFHEDVPMATTTGATIPVDGGFSNATPR